MFLTGLQTVNSRLLSLPISKLLTFSFLLVAFLPVSLLGFKVYQAAWDDAWREVNEKHRLLARNLASPVAIFIADHQAMLKLLSASVARIPTTDTKNIPDAALLRSAQNLDKFQYLAVLDRNGVSRLQIIGGESTAPAHTLFADDVTVRAAIHSATAQISGMRISPVSGKPALELVQPLFDEQQQLTGVLVGELKIDLIESLRQTIHFGEGGHSAIVDGHGRVVAHPNPLWMEEIKDLSHLDIVQRMITGQNGVMEFFSPFKKQQMVAGYATVPGIGWGIMVPQPKSEIEQQVLGLIVNQLGWGLLGFFLASAIAYAFTRRITRPVVQLAKNVNQLAANDYRDRLPVMFMNAPKEIQYLGFAMRNLINGLQDSRTYVSDLNRNLQNRVEKATAELTEANRRLEELASVDYLTRLANRRHFEHTLRKKLARRRSDGQPECFMLIDVDNFKSVNDNLGHAAGDTLLIQIATVLQGAMRPEDMVARYGGDEFIVYMRCDAAIAEQRARRIRELVDSIPFTWQGKSVHVTISIGLITCLNHSGFDLNQVVNKVDVAMYEAKKRGRNDVVCHHLDDNALPSEAPLRHRK